MDTVHCTCDVLRMLSIFVFLDLRQDMLTLQVMSIMDNLWRENGLDLRSAILLLHI